MVNYLGVIQARVSSSRLPAKVMLDLAGKTLLERVIDCARNSKFLDAIVVATSACKEDDMIAFLCENLGVPVFRGNLCNVLDRFIQIADLFQAKHIVRMTADNSLIFPEWIDKLIIFYKKNALKYSRCDGLPYGGAAEVFDKHMLDLVLTHHNNSQSQEHVTYYMDTYFGAQSYQTYLDYGSIRATIDTLEDYVFMNHYFWYCNHQKILPFFLDNFITYASVFKKGGDEI